MLSETRYGEYLSYVYELAGRKYSDCPEPDVLVQDTVLALIMKEASGETVEHPKGFLSTVLRNKHNDWLRRKYTDRIVSYEIPETVAAEEPPEDLSDDYTAVRREIGRLMAIYREVTVRYYMHGHSVERIADELGIPKGTVLSRLSSARKQLKGRLEPMKPYADISYAPKKMRMGIWGGTGLNDEPFSLVPSLIETNILILAYEHPLSVQAIADTMGMPCAYLEPLIEKLVNGELMGKTSGSLVYTRCFLQSYKQSLGNIPAQEAVAARHAEAVWAIVRNEIAPLLERPAIRIMTDKQKATLLLYSMVQTLSEAIMSIRGETKTTEMPLPERPNGGRWLAIGTVLEPTEARSNPYDCSGPFTVSHRPAHDSPVACTMFDYQSLFGDTHWRYHHLSYACGAQRLLRFLASFFTASVKPDTPLMYDLIPELETMHILRRDGDGEARADIPALTFEEEERYWAPAKKRIVAALKPLLQADLQALWNDYTHRVPKHIDQPEQFLHEGALRAYIPSQLLAIVDGGLLPYPVTVGKTPIMLLLYRGE